MIDRRTLTLGLGLAASLSTARASGQIAFSDPGKGPWVKDGFIRRAGGVLHYGRLGTYDAQKPTVVLLHKFGGWMADWRHVAPTLAKTRDVIAFDLPGHGDSRWDGEPPYIQSLSETAALIVGALDELGIGQIDLIGTSLGGCLSVPLAAHFPERVHRLALVSSALFGPSSLEQIATNIDEPEKKNFDAHGEPLPTDASLSADKMGLLNAAPISAEMNASRRRAGRWLQPSERGLAVTDVRGLLKRIEAPTLLLYGDRPNPYLKYREKAEAALKNSRTWFVPNSGAFVMQDNPVATAAKLIEFLDNSH
jgi:pimeloyl-ACP methyl ester carboxylesterase